MKNIVQRISLTKNDSTSPLLSTSDNKLYRQGLQTVMLVRLAEDGSFTVHRILPRQNPLSSDNRVPAYRGKNYHGCSKRRCLEKIALSFCGLQEKELNDCSFNIVEESLDIWKTDCYIKAIIDNQ